MATIKAGGRPQNAWTPSRKRKLVRLYTLTYLKVDEITKALADVGFNPSRRDVQSKLKSLFSDDYTKDHRKYRPSGPFNMKTRLRYIRQRKRVRSSATGGTCGDDHYPDAKPDSPLQMNPHTESSESICLCGNQDCNFSSSLNNFTTSSVLGFIPDSSEPIIPSQLPIDESSISPPPALDPLPTHPDDSVSASRTPYYQHAPPAVPLSEGVAPKITNRGSKISSFHWNLSNLDRKLANKYSSSILEHIQSVLRSTPGSSWKSSLLSFRNTDSFRGSSSPPMHKTSPGSNEAIPESLSMSLTDSKIQVIPESPINHPPKFTTVEQTIWDALIDETKLDLGSHKFFAPGLPSSLTKQCCKSVTFLSYKTSCITCGRTQAHWTANHAALSEIMAIPKQYLNEPDFFGNTALHYLMFNRYLETTRWNYCALVEIVKGGVDVGAINTFGQTFLHLLHETHDISASQFSTFISALRLLSLLGFPFGHRDRYGRTILHTVLQNNSSGFQSLADFENFITICGTSVHAYDIFGRTVLDLLKSRLLEIGMDQTQINLRIAEKYANQQQETALPIFSVQEASSPMIWIDKIKQGKLITWVDVDGNTPLHALLKIWPRRCGELQLSDLVSELLTEGADIHMRDRDGNIPLALAAIRGRRPSVQILLDAGGGIHCRNFCGRGILAQCYNARQKAKREANEELYAMILSCSTLLVDADAKERPSGMDEWLLSTTSGDTPA